MYTLYFTKQAQKDAKKIQQAGLKKNTQTLLDILAIDSFQSSPSYEKFIGDLRGAYSRRINI